MYLLPLFNIVNTPYRPPHGAAALLLWEEYTMQHVFEIGYLPHPLYEEGVPGFTKLPSGWYNLNISAEDAPYCNEYHIAVTNGDDEVYVHNSGVDDIQYMAVCYIPLAHPPTLYKDETPSWDPVSTLNLFRHCFNKADIYHMGNRCVAEIAYRQVA